MRLARRLLQKFYRVQAGGVFLVHFENDLPCVPARFHLPVSIGGSFHGEGAIDDWAQLSAYEQRPDVLLHGSRERGLLRDRARTQCRPGDHQPFDHQGAQIDGYQVAV